MVLPIYIPHLTLYLLHVRWINYYNTLSLSLSLSDFLSKPPLRTALCKTSPPTHSLSYLPAHPSTQPTNQLPQQSTWNLLPPHLTTFPSPRTCISWLCFSLCLTLSTNLLTAARVRLSIWDVRRHEMRWDEMRWDGVEGWSAVQSGGIQVG